MAGRNDFGILRADLLNDDRAHVAADLYAERGFARGDIAVAMVAGHVAMLGLHAMLHTDDGVLPGDGVAFAHAALLVPRPTAREIVACLTAAGLLRPVDGCGLYLVGFQDCYQPIIDAREQDRTRKALKRAEARLSLERRAREVEAAVSAASAPVSTSEAGEECPQDVRRTSDGHPAEKAVCPPVPYRTDRTVPNPPNAPARVPARAPSHARGPDEAPEPPGGAPASPEQNTSPPSAEDRAVAKVIVDRLRKSPSERERGVGDRMRSMLRDRAASGPLVRAFVDEWTPNFLEPVRDVRRTFAMARNGRNGHGHQDGTP